MNTCGNCGVELKEGANFCKACGTSLSGSKPSLQDKKSRVMTKEQQWKKPAMIAAGIVLLLAAAWVGKGVYMSKKMGGHPMFPPHRDASARLATAVPVKDQNGVVNIPLKAIEDNSAHFFAYNASGKTITFFIMKAKDGSIRSAFDACIACNHAKLGYRQEGDLVVCNNCGMGFKPTDIGMITGGCNPIAVTSSNNGQMIVLKSKDLEDGAKYF
jgi:hypothetical protein